MSWHHHETEWPAIDSPKPLQAQKAIALDDTGFEPVLDNRSVGGKLDLNLGEDAPKIEREKEMPQVAQVALNVDVCQKTAHVRASRRRRRHTRRAIV